MVSANSNLNFRVILREDQYRLKLWRDPLELTRSLVWAEPHAFSGVRSTSIASAGPEETFASPLVRRLTRSGSSSFAGLPQEGLNSGERSSSGHREVE